jgi:hypothetical protein
MDVPSKSVAEQLAVLPEPLAGLEAVKRKSSTSAFTKYCAAIVLPVRLFVTLQTDADMFSPGVRLSRTMQLDPDVDDTPIALPPVSDTVLL